MTTIEPEQAVASRMDARRAKLMRRPKTVAGDLWAGLQLHALWREMAWEDMVHKYRRSYLGVAWILLSFLSMVAVFVLIFGRSAPGFTQLDYTIYLSTGLLAWTFISQSIVQGCGVFQSNAGWLKISPMPISVLVYKNVLQNLFEIILISIFVIPLVLYYGIPSGVQALIVIAALIIYLINALWIGLFFGSISAWSSDFAQFVPAVMRILFFATPIFWVSGTRGGPRQILSDYNPLAHFVEMFRQPLMGGYPSSTNMMVIAGFTIGGWIAALIVFKIARQRLASWV